MRSEGKKRGISPWGKQCKLQTLLLGKKLEDVTADTGISRMYISAIIRDAGGTSEK